MTEAPDIFALQPEPREEGAKAFQMDVDTRAANIDLHDHRPETEAIREGESELGVHIPDRPERIPMVNRNPALDQDPVREIKDLVADSFTDTYDFGKVEVTADERQRFVRAALHDSEMWFDVLLEGINAKIRVVIPPEPFTTAAANAVSLWGKADAMDPSSNLQWYLAFQQIHAWYQVRAINDEPTAWSEMFEDGPMKTSALRKFINNPENFEEFFIMGSVKWRMMVEAMRIAEAKYKLCTQAWRDKSFFTSAGTA
jgi:hypothetical protein